MAASPPEIPHRPFIRGIVGAARGFRWLWLVPIFAAVSLGAWALASPLGASPDEDYHLASIWCANEGRSELCEPSPDSEGARLLPAAFERISCFVGDAETSGSCLGNLDQRAPFVEDTRGNWIGAYPPLYYGVMNGFASEDLQASALTMRFASIAIFLVLTSTLTVLLPRDLRVPLLAGWTISMVPLTGYLIVSNNPASWTAIGVGSVWLATLGWFRTSGWRMWALGGMTALLALMAAGSRTDGAVFVVLALGIASFLSFEAKRRYALKLVLPLALLVMAASFYFSSGYASVATSGLSSGVEGSESRSQVAVLAFNLVSLPQLWTGVFGSWGLGWRMEVWPGFAMVEFATLAVFIGLASLGLRLMDWRKAVMAMALVATLYFLPVYILTQGLSVVSENVQPRYLVPLVIILGGLLLLPSRGRHVQPGPWHIIPAIVLLAGANSVALYTTLRRYVTGFDVEAPSLDAGAEWWWSGLGIGPNAVWVIGSLAFASAVAVLGVAWLRAGISSAEESPRSS